MPTKSEAISEIIELVVEGMSNAFYGPDSEIEIYLNLTFIVFCIKPCKLAVT